MAILQYVGARYVPVFFKNPNGTWNWADNTYYEALTIVNYNNSSYTSKLPVPANIGNPADNPDYWAVTGNYNGQISAITESLKGIANNRKFIFIGDSYFLVNDSGSVKTILQNLIPGCYVNAEHGSGFTNGKTFQSLLTEVAGTITDKKSITDIWFVGGSNDLNSSSITTAISQLAPYVKATFPNANVFVAFDHYSKTASVRSQFYRVLYGYENVGFVGWTFIEDSYNWLNNMTVGEDGTHPNSIGSSYIAFAICANIAGKEFSHFPQANVDVSNASNTTVNFTLKVDRLFRSFRALFGEGSITFNTPVSPLAEVDFAYTPQNYFNMDVGKTFQIPAIVAGPNGGFEAASVVARITTGKLVGTIYARSNLEVKTIMFPAFEVCVDGF